MFFFFFFFDDDVEEVEKRVFRERSNAFFLSCLLFPRLAATKEYSHLQA